MRRPLALVAVIAIAVIGWVVWKGHERDLGDLAPACTYATLERVSFPGGHVTTRTKKGGSLEMKVDVHITSREKTVACEPTETNDDCKARAAKDFGPLPTPADRLEVAISDSAGRIARVSPSFWAVRHAIAHEQQTWVPDTPGAEPASGGAFKANFDGAWVAGVIVGPSAGGNYLLDVWCSTKEAPMPGTKAIGTNGAASE